MLLTLFIMTGCARVSSEWLEIEKQSPKIIKLQVPPFHPQDAYQCGPSVMAMLLEESGTKVTPQELTPPIIYTPSKKKVLCSLR